MIENSACAKEKLTIDAAECMDGSALARTAISAPPAPRCTADHSYQDGNKVDSGGGWMERGYDV